MDAMLHKLLVNPLVTIRRSGLVPNPLPILQSACISSSVQGWLSVTGQANRAALPLLGEPELTVVSFTQCLFLFL